jgi:hypothetical protein
MYAEQTELTFKFLTALEPRLRELADDCRRYWLSHEADDRETERVWYLRFKPAMSRLVGFGCDTPELMTSQAYDTAYQALFNILTTGREVGDKKVRRILQTLPKVGSPPVSDTHIRPLEPRLQDD